MGFKGKAVFRFIIISIFFFCALHQQCDPVSSDSLTFDTHYGPVTRIDDYPLYAMTYTADYNFQDYLRTGVFPFSASGSDNGADFECTCFTAFGGGQRLLGRNYDWDVPSTYYLVFTDPGNGYASVSTVDLVFFDYHHAESPDHSGNQAVLRTLPYFPFDGMNEKGLAIGMNAVPGAQPSYDYTKVTIGELQLIRLVLDYAGSVNEAIALIRQYNVRMEDPPVHYLIADSSGHSVIIEFVNGNMEILENTDHWQVTTNFVITGLNRPSDAPCWRYRTAYETLQTNLGEMTDSGAVALLRNVSVSSTRWSTVYDQKMGRLQIAMGRHYENLHFFTVR